MNEFKKGLLTGMLLIISILLFVNATREKSETGKYQISLAAAGSGDIRVPYGVIIDTKTGEIKRLIRFQPYDFKVYKPDE